MRYSVEEAQEKQDALDERVCLLLEVLPVEDLRALARTLWDELGNLTDHLPDAREPVERYACTGNSYHGCSFSGSHQQGCRAIGGDGVLVGSAYGSARSCEPDCDASAPREPWCSAGGFDCSYCKLIDVVLGLIGANGG